MRRKPGRQSTQLCLLTAPVSCRPLLAVRSLVCAEIAFMLAQSFDFSLHQRRRIPDLINDTAKFVFCHAQGVRPRLRLPGATKIYLGSVVLLGLGQAHEYRLGSSR